MNNNYYGMNNDIPSVTGLKLSEHMWWLFSLTMARLICMLPSMNGDSLNSTLTNIILSIIAVINTIRLFKLSSYEYDYRKTAVWLVAYCIFKFVFTVTALILLTAIDIGRGLTTILVIAIILESIVSNTLKAVSVYFCCKAHKELIGAENYSLCEKWSIFSIAYITSATIIVLIEIINIFLNTPKAMSSLASAITVLISVSMLIFECVLLVMNANLCRKMK